MTLAVLIYRADTYQSAFLLLVPLVPYIESKIVRNRSEAILFETISIHFVVAGWFEILKCEPSTTNVSVVIYGETHELK